MTVKTLTRRGRLETIYLILTLAQTVQKKTHIMYQANLNYVQLVKFVSYLVERGLIRETRNGLLTTQRGRQYIQRFRELLRISSEPETRVPF